MAQNVDIPMEDLNLEEEEQEYIPPDHAALLDDSRPDFRVPPRGGSGLSDAEKEERRKNWEVTANVALAKSRNNATALHERLNNITNEQVDTYTELTGIDPQAALTENPDLRARILATGLDTVQTIATLGQDIHPLMITQEDCNRLAHTFDSDPEPELSVVDLVKQLLAQQTGLDIDHFKPDVQIDSLGITAAKGAEISAAYLNETGWEMPENWWTKYRTIQELFKAPEFGEDTMEEDDGEDTDEMEED